MSQQLHPLLDRRISCLSQPIPQALWIWTARLNPVIFTVEVEVTGFKIAILKTHTLILLVNW